MSKYCKLTFPNDIELHMPLPALPVPADGSPAPVITFTIKLGRDKTATFIYDGTNNSLSLEGSVEHKRINEARPTGGYRVSSIRSTGKSFAFESDPPVKDPPTKR